MTDSAIQIVGCREFTGMNPAQIQTTWETHALRGFGRILSHQIQIAIHNKIRELNNCEPDKIPELRGNIAGMNQVLSILSKPKPENIE